MDKKTNLQTIGKVLRETRLSAKLTQYDMADYFQKTVSAISRWESGLREMNVSELIKWFDACKLSPQAKQEALLQIIFAEQPDMIQRLKEINK